MCGDIQLPLRANLDHSLTQLCARHHLQGTTQIFQCVNGEAKPLVRRDRSAGNRRVIHNLAVALLERVKN